VINADGVKLEDMTIEVIRDGRVIAEIVIDEAMPTPDKLSMKFNAIASVMGYSIQFSAVRRFTEDEEAFYKEGKEQA